MSKVSKNEDELSGFQIIVLLGSLSIIIGGIFSYFVKDVTVEEFIIAWMNYFISNSFYVYIISCSGIMMYFIGFLISLLIFNKTLLKSLLWPVRFIGLLIDGFFDLLACIGMIFIDNNNF